jgi:tetratricopeptide (TPR) repeat protein
MTEAAAFAYDVFISYSSQDKDWVRGELLTRIEEAGIKAFIDFRDFTRGSPSFKEMERGLFESRKTLLVLTPNYIASEWAESESLMLQGLGPANRDLRLIPVLKAECQKPLRIQTLTHIDFTESADHQLAWRQILTALGRPPEPEAPKQPPAERKDWDLVHPYPMPANFTGRNAEREMLQTWLDAEGNPLLVIRALGGFGKSSLVWYWLLHDVAPTSWPHVVWWSFYEADASLDNFLLRTLKHLRVADSNRCSGKQGAAILLDELCKPGTLLVLDGFERMLRAYGGLDGGHRGEDEGQHEHAGSHDADCVSPIADYFLRHLVSRPGIRSKVLLTTRLLPRALEAMGGGVIEGCREEELKQMHPADAIAFFHAQGIRGTNTELAAACEAYGYHPLSLRLLARLIVVDLEQPGDIAAAASLDVTGDLRMRQHHVLASSYDRLTPRQQALLSRIACFRGYVRYEAIQKVSETDAARPKRELDSDLRDLIARGLLRHDTRDRRFDLHPIVRRYAYDRLEADTRKPVHAHLRKYFMSLPAPARVTRLDDLASTIELFHHTVRSGEYEDACELFFERLHAPTFEFGANPLRIDLLSTLLPAEGGQPLLTDEHQEHLMLTNLARAYQSNGQPRRSMSLLTRVTEIVERWNAFPTHWGVLALVQLKVGEIRESVVTCRRLLELATETREDENIAVCREILGRVLAYSGADEESELEFQRAMDFWVEMGDVQGQGLIEADRALLALLKYQRDPRSQDEARDTALRKARRALELAERTARTRVTVERDFVRAHWLLGAAYQAAGDQAYAEPHLFEALELCRRFNMVDHEAEILVHVAQINEDSGAAQRILEETLILARRSSYVLQEADARLGLARLAFARGEIKTAHQHASEARRLAECDGPPHFTYKAAYDEAGSLLDQLSVA